MDRFEGGSGLSVVLLQYYNIMVGANVIILTACRNSFHQKVSPEAMSAFVLPFCT
jgi:hypothetical protein